jgi:FkbM family methyltransferase
VVQMITLKKKLKELPGIGPLLVSTKRVMMSLRPHHVYMYTVKPALIHRCITFLRAMVPVHMLSVTKDATVVDTGSARFVWKPGDAYSLLGYPLRGSFEDAETRTAIELARTSNIIIDIGANFGWYACHFLASMPANGELHLFEPAPSILPQLKVNLDLNRRPGITTIINELCLSDSEGETILHVPVKEGEAFASIRPQSLYGKSVEIRRPTVTLDAYCQKHGVTKVDFLKIDVEGAELKVLAGAKQILSSPFPPAILIESQDYTVRAFGHTVRDVIDHIKQYGYRGYVFTITTGALVPLTDETMEAGYNFLFLGRGTPATDSIIQQHLAEAGGRA